MKLKLFFLQILLLSAFFSNAQSPKKINISDLIHECTKHSGQTSSKQMALWLAHDFWSIISSQMKLPSYSGHELKDYLVFLVVDYNIMQSADLVFKSKDEIEKTILLTDSLGRTYLPLKDEELSNGAYKLLEMMKPSLQKMLGQFGEGMRIIIFKAPKTDTKNLFDISKKNSFKLSWDTTSLKWKLPFYSVLPPKFCPVDNEEMKGNWDFCPEHGKSLK